MYWIVFSDNVTNKGSVSYAKARCAALGCTYRILCQTRKVEMEYAV